MSPPTTPRQSLKPWDDQRDTNSRMKIVALVFSSLVSLAAGTPYLFGIYSPQLISRCQFSASDSSLLSVASSVGSSIGGFAAGLFIDRFGPSWAVLLGAVLESSGFFILYMCYRYRAHQFGLLLLAMVNVGFGSVLPYFSALKVATVNFPNHRGAANAGPVSAYGLAALFYASISTIFFKGNTSGLLEFIAIFAGGIMGVGSLFVGLYEQDPNQSESSTQPQSTLPRQGSHNHHPSGLGNTNEEPTGLAYLLKGHRGSFAQVNLIRSNSTTSMFSTMSEASSSTVSASSSYSQLSSQFNNPIPINFSGSTTPMVARSYSDSPGSSGGMPVSKSSGQLSNLLSGSPVEFKAKHLIGRANSYRNNSSLSNSPRGVNFFGSIPKRTFKEEAVVDEETPLLTSLPSDLSKDYPSLNFSSMSNGGDMSKKDGIYPIQQQQQQQQQQLHRQYSNGSVPHQESSIPQPQSQLQPPPPPQQQQQQFTTQNIPTSSSATQLPTIPVDNSQLVELLSKRKKKRSKTKHTTKSHLISLLGNKTFIGHYLLNALYCATGQIYIFCVGFIVKAQLNNQNLNPSLIKLTMLVTTGSPNTLLKPDEDLSSSYQALQVSIISFSNFLGRLLAGPASDLIHKSWKLQRVWVVLFSVVVLGLGQLTLLLLNDINSLSLSSLLIGFSYGSLYGTLPAIVADMFGSKSFATTWSLIGTGPITVFLCLSHYFGKAYDKQSEYVDDGAGLFVKVCLKGKKCYDEVFMFTSGICVFLFIGYSILIYTKDTGKNKR